MLGSCKFTGFALTTQPEVAKRFYRDTLGLRLVREDDYGMEFETGGAILRLSRIDAFQPAAHTIAGWTVDNLESTVRGLAAAGVSFRRYDGMAQDDLGIWSPDGVSRVAWFSDPDGNTLSVTQVA
ncbi:MAG: VOC family protein [Chloroflexi bacterium]|nr:VOC family protein [Chloroflexota bacterium]